MGIRYTNPRTNCPVCGKECAVIMGKVGAHNHPPTEARKPWTSRPCTGRGILVRPEDAKRTDYDPNWLQMSYAGSKGKFHRAIWPADVNAPVSLCGELQEGTGYINGALDPDRPMDQLNPNHRKCVPCNAAVQEGKHLMGDYDDPVLEELERIAMVSVHERHARTRSRAEILSNKAERLRRQADDIEERAARYAALPEEPEVEDGEPAVIYFTKAFGQPLGRDYTYAAVRVADEGLWYTTGPKTPKGYTWAALIEWITDADPEAQVWLATAYEELPYRD